MKGGLTARHKIVLVFICFVVAVAGFMLKLPAPFRHIDKQLHALFYFLAAALLNILFVKRKLLKHIAVFLVLCIFGFSIEWAQSWSNRFFRKRIHGRFDPEDMEANIVGLIAFSTIWVVYVMVVWVFKKGNSKNTQVK